jgi:hypothetical protein
MPSHNWDGFKQQLTDALGSVENAALSGKTISALALTLSFYMLF